MDNLDTLFKKKQYDLVIKLTELSSDPKELFLRISSFVSLGKIDEALDTIEKYQSIVEKEYPYQLMKLHFELLLSKSLYDEARIALRHYEDLPYVSQEVEEFMRDMKSRIEEETNPKQVKNYSMDEICDVLEKETNQGIVSRILFSLKNYNVNIYIDSLKKFLIREDIHPNFRTYGLILLVDNKYDEEISFLSIKGIIKVNPNKLFPPFMSKEFNEVCRLISEKANQNITLTETALHLFNCFIIDTYPINIYDKSAEDLSNAFIYIASQYLNINVSSFDENTMKIINNIKYILESTPDIKM
jgi:hypothetical protein